MAGLQATAQQSSPLGLSMLCSRRPPKPTASLTGAPMSPEEGLGVVLKGHCTDALSLAALSGPGMNRIHCLLVFVAGSSVLTAYFPFVSHDPELRGIIVFKGNIILSSGKKKGCTKKVCTVGMHGHLHTVNIKRQLLPV